MRRCLMAMSRSELSLAIVRLICCLISVMVANSAATTAHTSTPAKTWHYRLDRKAYDQAVRERTKRRDIQVYFAAVRSVWNRDRLQTGEHLRGCEQKGDGHNRAHPLAWTVPGLLRVAFERISQVASHRSRATSHSIEAVAAASLAHRAHQADHAKQL